MIFTTRKLVGFTLALSLVGCSTTYESAEESYRNGDIQDAKIAWTELAVEGDSRSMYRLYTSTNHPSDEEVSWLKQAADAGLVEAQYEYAQWLLRDSQYKHANNYLKLAAAYGSRAAKNFIAQNEALIPLWIKSEAGDALATQQLGEHYWKKKEYTTALHWYKQCVDNYTSCSFYLGLAYDVGYDGVKQDYAQAIKWYEKSAGYGNTDAARNLAWLHEDGKGTPIDKQKAFHWMTKAAKSEGIVPMATLGRYHLYGVGTPKNTQKAFDLLNKTANDSKYSAYHLARMYHDGNGVDKNHELSYKWFLSASKKDHAASEWYIGQHYYLGLGRDKNHVEAFKWYTKSAEKGDSDAQFRLGWMLSNGEGVAKNYRQSREWYKKAANQNYLSAQNNLGYMYENGLGGAKDNAKAHHWYKKAAVSGDAMAQHNVGLTYEYGRGVNKDYPLAVYWYAKAAQNNYKDAQGSINDILYKLSTRTVNIREASVYSRADFDSKALMNIMQGGKVYVLSKGSQWTEVYYPENNTLGYIHNTHLR